MKNTFVRHLCLMGLCLALFLFLPYFFNPQRKQHRVAEPARSELSLFVEPEAGEAPILELLNSAQHEIFVAMYLLTDKNIIAALESATVRGVDVKVMMEQKPYQTGALAQKTFKTLEEKRIPHNSSNQDFALTHEKAFIIDQKILLVMNQNMTSSAFEKNREFNIVDRNLIDVTEARKIFLADWERKSLDLSSSHLLVSPYNSRLNLVELIVSAEKSVQMEMEVLTDPEMIDLLLKECKSKKIEVLLADFSKVEANQETAKKLNDGCVIAKTLKTPYIHAKLIVADQKKAYVGSINFTAYSMDKNRELGILISQPDIIDQLNQVFANDWLLAS